MMGGGIKARRQLAGLQASGHTWNSQGTYQALNELGTVCFTLSFSTNLFFQVSDVILTSCILSDTQGHTTKNDDTHMRTSPFWASQCCPHCYIPPAPLLLLMQLSSAFCITFSLIHPHLHCPHSWVNEVSCYMGISTSSMSLDAGCGTPHCLPHFHDQWQPE